MPKFKRAAVFIVILLTVFYYYVDAFVFAETKSNLSCLFSINEKKDVWDFGAANLNNSEYNNELTVNIINSWYSSDVEQGSVGNVFPTSFSAGRLEWTGGSNDRLRTNQNLLTRFDENHGGTGDFIGRLYVNAAAAVNRALFIELEEDDTVTLFLKTDTGGVLNFEYKGETAYQLDQISIGTDIMEVKLTANYAGKYKIYDSQGKPSYYRIIREGANFKTVSGNIYLPDNNLGDYKVIFKNIMTGKKFYVSNPLNTYSVSLPLNHHYEVGIDGVNGYIIDGERKIYVDENRNFNITIIKVEVYTVSGAIHGISGEQLDTLELEFIPISSEETEYVPQVLVDRNTGRYIVNLEPYIEYEINLLNLNDYEISVNKNIKVSSDEIRDIQLVLKPVYDVILDIDHLDDKVKTEIYITFKNLREEGYEYTFKDLNDIKLRDGVYKIISGGISAYPYEMELTSNLVVSGKSVTKQVKFKDRFPYWDFSMLNESDNIKKRFHGLILEGDIKSNKTYALAAKGSQIIVPVNPGDKIEVGYCYENNFYFDDDIENPIVGKSGNTSQSEYISYKYEGKKTGNVIINVLGTTYFEYVSALPETQYLSEINVGKDKEYKTIQDAIFAVSLMKRENNERVIINIDPGNYEEMLVIKTPNITLKNSSSTPSLALENKGVDIAKDAVRITSYYGHGYNYYSMDGNSKWNRLVLEVNKENGELSNTNVGSGTQRGSYWNATVVLFAEGFKGEGIIFENSFNQYISKKEAEDTVIMWESGNKGQRPTTYGDVSVQKREFVERAAAIAILGDKAVFDQCRFVGRQDTLYGAKSMRAVFNECIVMGGVDYIFGGMTAVFYRCELVLNTSDASNDTAYITAAQQDAGRGFLMYECVIKSIVPGVESASIKKSNAGFFGRPWQANTSETVFIKTIIEVGDDGKSLINPEGWRDSLGGRAPVYEYYTIELSNEDNISKRVPWSIVLTEEEYNEYPFTPYEFIKGNDKWNPLEEYMVVK